MYGFMYTYFVSAEFYWIIVYTNVLVIFTFFTVLFKNVFMRSGNFLMFATEMSFIVISVYLGTFVFSLLHHLFIVNSELTFLQTLIPLLIWIILTVMLGFGLYKIDKLGKVLKLQSNQLILITRKLLVCVPFLLLNFIVYGREIDVSTSITMYFVIFSTVFLLSEMFLSIKNKKFDWFVVTVTLLTTINLVIGIRYNSFFTSSDNHFALLLSEKAIGYLIIRLISVVSIFLVYYLVECKNKLTGTKIFLINTLLYFIISIIFYTLIFETMIKVTMD